MFASFMQKSSPIYALFNSVKWRATLILTCNTHIHTHTHIHTCRGVILTPGKRINLRVHVFNAFLFLQILFKSIELSARCLLVPQNKKVTKDIIIYMLFG